MSVRIREYHIPGRTAAQKLAKKGVVLPKNLERGRFHVTHMQGARKLGGNTIVEYFPSGGYGEGIHAPKTVIEMHPTERGLLIHNAQSRSRLGRMEGRQLEETQGFLDSKVGMHLGLDIIKENNPNTQIHILAPNEMRKKWGLRSRFHLSSPRFFDYMGKLPPEEYETILRRLVFEHPEYTPALGDGSFPPELLRRLSKEAEKARSLGKSVPGRNKLRRALADFSQKTKYKPLGKRMSKAYYRDIPMEHGFHENKHPIDFGVHGIRHALTLESGVHENVWGEHMELHGHY